VSWADRRTAAPVLGSEAARPVPSVSSVSGQQALSPCSLCRRFGCNGWITVSIARWVTERKPALS
jgi:hypothetical protein